MFYASFVLSEIIIQSLMTCVTIVKCYDDFFINVYDTQKYSLGFKIRAVGFFRAVVSNQLSDIRISRHLFKMRC